MRSWDLLTRPLGKRLGERKAAPLQHPCLEFMDRGACALQSMGSQESQTEQLTRLDGKERVGQLHAPLGGRIRALIEVPLYFPFTLRIFFSATNDHLSLEFMGLSEMFYNRVILIHPSTPVISLHQVAAVPASFTAQWIS